mmetsp:Transcript_39544/g.40093  ORF Transcript_39544/g.40093 Transcript_39544/m.40093 type:complete len:111 (-) Transcript_39544:1017-1349(-)
MWSTRILLSLLISSKTFLQTSALRIAITGSSQGIGLEAAKSLLRDGSMVYHACRSLKRAQVAVEIQDPAVCSVGLDVCVSQCRCGTLHQSWTGRGTATNETSRSFPACVT